MGAELVSLVALFSCMLLVLASVGLLWFSYRKYFSRMKAAHPLEWDKLMKRDPLIDAAGAWVRWPVGSIYLYTSIFRRSETYGDDEIKRYKQDAVKYSLVLVLSVVALSAGVYVTK